MQLSEDSVVDTTLEVNFTDYVYSMTNLVIGVTGKRVTLDIKEGYWYSIVGESGSGKSTFIRLLLGLADTEFDSFKFGGHNMSAINGEFVLSKVAVVNQKPLLFKGSLLDNLSYASSNPSSPDILVPMLEMLNLKHFTSFLDSKSTDWVNQASGGELQRLSILRAYLRKKQVIILDEPTSSLDEKNVMTVLEFIKNNFSTVIMVTHNHNALRFTDYVMDLSTENPDFTSHLL